MNRKDLRDFIVTKLKLKRIENVFEGGKRIQDLDEIKVILCINVYRLESKFTAQTKI